MQLERRHFAMRDVQVGDEDAPVVEGYAAVFNADSVDMGFIERIAPGAFKRSIGEAEIIHAYWNHNSDLVLGSTRSGKLTLEEDAEGLRFRLDAARLTPPQLDAVRDGDMRMSFGFLTREDHWEERNGQLYRTLIDVDLYEISPVSNPAYPDTSAALRSRDAWRTKPDHSARLARMDMTLALTRRPTRSRL